MISEMRCTIPDISISVPAVNQVLVGFKVQNSMLQPSFS